MEGITKSGVMVQITLSIVVAAHIWCLIFKGCHVLQVPIFIFMITMVNSISSSFMMDNVLSITAVILRLISPIIPLSTVTMLLHGTEVHRILNAGRSNMCRQKMVRGVQKKPELHLSAKSCEETQSMP